MYLKSVSLKGFKSFPDRARLEFSPGVSVIVGPNGCGKSNITDAVLWALGEQSPLAVRGQSMQDVVFAGGEGQGRRRFAEVEVVIDNSEGRADTEFSEISIRRRLERNGEGEYRLNGARCRLVDVLEVLSDANLGREMHSVISQGRVEEIVHSKPRDRRLLIEEAAGLGKHRKRRRRAQLKLDRTRDNLGRALDVEREARSRLRPLKRQAEAAEHHSRIERQELELRALVVADDLRARSELLAAAERQAATARKGREAVERKLAGVHEGRERAEERFAARDRERRHAWAALSRLRGWHERLAVRAETLEGREAELTARLAADRQLLLPVGPRPRRGREAELDAIEAALAASGEALVDARGAGGDPERAAALARVREGAEAAARSAQRAERLLAGGRRGSFERRVAEAEALLVAVGRLRESAAEVAAALGRRVETLEQRVDSEAGDDDDVAGEMRSLSRQEWGLQSQLKAASDRFTAAEVEATQLRDRHGEAAAELGDISRRLATEVAPATEPLPDGEREEIARKLDRLARRREQIGPVNPLAEGQYEDARAHVEELEAQRADLEAALAELQRLIDETDRRIHDAFEGTLEATARNFEELVAHLFPGGRGRLRRVAQPGPRPVIGGAAPESGDEDASDAAEPGDPELGVEIEVTPAGKATKRLSLLSGGEKSLVALAFVFAVLLARPCPFYILDEVEAALDDANIDRFLQLVRRYADRSQFVIVTHQKRTMDAADVLYGVSMGGDGVTKVVSRRLPRDENEVEARELPAEAA